jgi:catechol 2,3-dioxygenase-like lactoylglutathione lyase family enzyme
MIALNHTIVPARDKVAAARFFARIFGLRFSRRSGYFAPVRVNKTLTLLFDDDAKFESHHYAFHVSKAEFDAIFRRIQKAGIPYGSAPWSLEDGKLNDWGGGRGVYFKDPDGHVLELMTVPQ